MTKHVKPSRLSICRWLAAFTLGGLALNAYAIDQMYNWNGLEFVTSGNTTHVHPASPESTRLRGGWTLDISDVEPKATASHNLPYKNNSNPPAKLTAGWPISPQKLNAGATKALEAGLAGLSTGNGYVAAASVVCAFVCEPLIQMLVDEGLDLIKPNPDGTASIVVPDTSVPHEVSTGLYYRVNWDSSIHLSPNSACIASRASYPGQSQYSNFVEARPSGGGFTCVFSNNSGSHLDLTSISLVSGIYSNCPAGSYVVNGSCTGELQKTEMPIGTYLESNYTGKGWSQHWAGITAGLVAAGVNVFTDGTGTTITGPAVVPVSTSQTQTPVNLSPGTTNPAPSGHIGPTDSGTQTTTTTTTAHNTYRPGSSGSGPSIETKTQTQTTTNITNNITNNTSSTVITNTTETDKAPEKEDKDFCEKNPDSLACAETDTPEQETPTGQLNIGYEYVDIFGNGSCPSDSYLNTHGQSLKVWDWAATCDNVQSYFRPILIACCAFAAFVIVSAGAKE